MSVLDADPEARKGAQAVVVKILDTHQPVPPAVVVAGHEFRPVEFDGLTVTPYLDDKRKRVAYSLRARAMRAPVKGAKASGSPASPRLVEAAEFGEDVAEWYDLTAEQIDQAVGYFRRNLRIA